MCHENVGLLAEAIPLLTACLYLLPAPALPYHSPWPGGRTTRSCQAPSASSRWTSARARLTGAACAAPRQQSTPCAGARWPGYPSCSLSSATRTRCSSSQCGMPPTWSGGSRCCPHSSRWARRPSSISPTGDRMSWPSSQRQTRPSLALALPLHRPRPRPRPRLHPRPRPRPRRTLGPPQLTSPHFAPSPRSLPQRQLPFPLRPPPFPEQIPSRSTVVNGETVSPRGNTQAMLEAKVLTLS